MRSPLSDRVALTLPYSLSAPLSACAHFRVFLAAPGRPWPSLQPLPIICSEVPTGFLISNSLEPTEAEKGKTEA
jgi:hypothetical protein